MRLRQLRVSHLTWPARRTVLASLLVLGLLALGLTHAKPARANDFPGWSVVEASQDFCVNPYASCSDMDHLYNLGYEEVAAVNHAGSPGARPDTVVLVCAKAYLDSSTGHVHNLAGHVFAGYDPGTIRGSMLVRHKANESTTAAYGSVALRVSDFALGTYGTAYGWQLTNNVTDTPIQSAITVTISGNLEDTDVTANGLEGQPTIVQGTISCYITPNYAIGPAPIGQPPDSESVISDTDSD